MASLNLVNRVSSQGEFEMEPSLPTPDLFGFSPSPLSGEVRLLTSFNNGEITSMLSAGSRQAIVQSDSLSSSPLVPPLAAAPIVGTGTGLLGQYYNGLNFDSLQLTRIDPTVDFDWSFGSPGGSIETDRFSVRWTGKVQPKYSEAYTFYIRSDDGIRLWVNGKQIVNNWTLHRAVEESDTITLVAGETYDIKIEYYENTGAAISKLSWSSASQAKQIIPQSQLYGPNLTLPSANLLPTNSTVTNGSSNYQFSVVYSDNTGIDQSTIDNQDILVSGPDKFSQFAKLVNISRNPDSRILTATYSILAPGGIWNANIVGNFEITLQGNQVSDIDNNFIDSSTLGSFQVDFVPPTATLALKEPVLGGSTRYSFSVTYDDNMLVYPDTLDDQDLLVTGPNNFSQFAKLVSFSPLKNSSSVTGVYSIEAPNGIWDTKSNGIYTVALRSYQISDTNENFIPATILGTIKVDLRTYAGDFDGDGKVDVLSRDLNRQKVSVLLMNGTLPNNQLPLPDMSANYSIVEIADFNGDGKSDILWRDSANQKVVMWVMNGNTLSSRAFLPDMSANNSIIDVADFNGDGTADLLWRDSTNQKVVIWLMDGTTVISQLFLRGYG